MLVKGRDENEGGSAIVEFVFVALIVMIPLVYLLAAVSEVQRSQLAVSQAAREAGRALVTSAGAHDAQRRVQAAVRLAFAAQHLPDDAEVRYVAAGESCTSASLAPRIEPGAQFTVCIVRHVRVPAVPSVVAGRGVTSVGSYVVHVDDFRTVQP